MAYNRFNGLILLAAFLAVFCAGGWFFSSFLRMSGASEVERLYMENGESVGIFDRIPPQDQAAAAAVAAEALGLDTFTPQETEQAEIYKVPSQITLTDLKDIAGLAPKTEEGGSFQNTERSIKEDDALLRLTGSEITVPANQRFDALPEQDSKISLIEVPVKYKLIKNTAGYKDFKTQARGNYPTVDFDKQMLVVLESDSDFPDKVFEIISAEEKDGQLEVLYRVNMFGLDKKTNTHSVLPVNKTDAPVTLKQVK